ncbi:MULTISPECIES: hypothetical protein [Acinetobacter]|uniref:hypothetical protein n=1 Tax=Acinetobacter TaxID=469 RepID=UPI002096B537|nr:hypothetical protein [Acinetobacter towneri]MCO8060314.1 hypothetical protein [Acinetobacter towneri]MCO8065962.1 hypothetical protein [Acinetobacter towneri]
MNSIKESDTCNFIGWGIITLGVISGLVFILAFGRIEIPRPYYGTRTVWSGMMISTGIGIMLNGFFLGYLFQKIASILRYHEANKSKI